MATVRVQGQDEFKACLQKIHAAQNMLLLQGDMDRSKLVEALDHAERMLSDIFTAVKSYDQKVAAKIAERHGDLEALYTIKAQAENDRRAQDDAVAAMKTTAQTAVENEKEFEALKVLLNKWPLAVDPSLICDASSAEDRRVRAEQILDMLLEEPLQGKSFLDFGCGMGESAEAAMGRGCTKAVGYDRGPFSTTKGITLSEFEKVKLHGPYDVVLLYDVLDHTDDMVAAMRQVREVVKPTSRVYLRCHPWSSRHGGHLYKELNAAYAHIVFTPNELSKLGHQLAPSQRVIYPLWNYREVFKNSNFEVMKEQPLEEDVMADDGFFVKNAVIKDRIIKAWSGLPDFPAWHLSLSFVDYIVAPF